MRLLFVHIQLRLSAYFHAVVELRRCTIVRSLEQILKNYVLIIISKYMRGFLASGISAAKSANSGYTHCTYYIASTIIIFRMFLVSAESQAFNI